MQLRNKDEFSFHANFKLVSQLFTSQHSKCDSAKFDKWNIPFKILKVYLFCFQHTVHKFSSFFSDGLLLVYSSTELKMRVESQWSITILRSCKIKSD